ncbi:MAG: glycosyltransferase [Desulfobacterales bacterium]|jgi:glycosyltransferase involved in cell wall biosynthesis
MKELTIIGPLNTDQEYSHNKIILEALKNCGWGIKDCSIRSLKISPKLPFFLRLLGTISIIPLQWMLIFYKYILNHPTEVLFIPYPAHANAPLVWLLSRFSDKIIIIDAFFGLYDTIVNDRGLVKRDGFIARVIYHYEKWLFNHVDIVLLDTPVHCERVRHDMGITTTRFEHVPVGIDESIWYPADPNQNESEFNVLFWSTFIPLHGVEVIANAAKLLEAPDSKIQFTVIGRGQLAPAFKKLLDELQPSNLRWIHQFISMAELRRHVEASQCCLGIFGKSAKADSVIPYKVHQTLASGKPLITAATRASTHYLKNGKHSILIPPGNPRALAEAIRNLKNDPASAMRIGRNGRLLYEQQFSNQIIVDKLRNLLDTL